MGILQARTVQWVPCPPLGDLPNPEIEPMPPTLQADSLPGNHKNTGVGTLSLLQRMFLTQESNQGVLLQMDSLLAELPGKPGKAIKLFFVLLHPKLCLQYGIQHQYPCIGPNQSILKEISPEYSLEGLMLKLKLQYFGHLMQRTDSLEKTLMLGKIEGRRRKERQRIR